MRGPVLTRNPQWARQVLPHELETNGNMFPAGVCDRHLQLYAVPTSIGALGPRQGLRPKSRYVPDPPSAPPSAGHANQLALHNVRQSAVPERGAGFDAQTGYASRTCALISRDAPASRSTAAPERPSLRASGSAGHPPTRPSTSATKSASTRTGSRRPKIPPASAAGERFLEQPGDPVN